MQTINPEVGHGAKIIEIQKCLAVVKWPQMLKISGLRISNCIHISAPNENPITQLSFEFGLLLCTKFSALRLIYDLS